MILTKLRVHQTWDEYGSHQIHQIKGTETIRSILYIVHIPTWEFMKRVREKSSQLLMCREIDS